jgi:hypothetical protein
MDPIVLRSMLKWPDVRAVYGWLRLDRRGGWLIKTVADRFERIANPALADFIGRNYAADAEGRWYFQNGPQRVFVALDYTPWVYRLDDAGNAVLAHTGTAPRALEAAFLDDAGNAFLAHTGTAPRALEAAFLDDAGALLLKTEMGIGVLLDRDLPAVLERLADDRGRAVERRLEEIAQGAEAQLMLHGKTLAVAFIRDADVSRRFGFVARPAPREGEPEC